ncbi:uncharacterized protein LOC103314861 isoform X1 [Tribolium castaneum]|uniref:Uncharacterized protein n=1 Tax=Tribolium castaneum TaxID=7070 RepID=A0A139W8B8_TRICA|nr:PREDICTED: uncharacterized protein LOC103314861 isoform X1 [Tribolium castaneum]KXZ75512.1 hypothetical protein TcasGA2_TC031749 [Tribolium castaneum]|eukprot:XP_008200196.1 PREDICTED: uncharacterized protein LOC103314861 isoform X1 [Tribolium castaneum]
MCPLHENHAKFIEKALVSSQFLPSVYSAIPTLVFLISSFVLLYQHLHRNTTLHTRWKTRIARDLKFHWIYFNATRLWYISMSCFRRLIAVAEEYIDINMTEKEKHFNLIMTYVASTVIITTLAILPIFLIYVNYWSKYDMPNFLMWVMEDPYIRHEIGISGHCLERPLRIDTKKLKNYPYRSKRSTSFDTNPWLAQKPAVICRSCKSMIENNVVNSVEELLDK